MTTKAYLKALLAALIIHQSLPIFAGIGRLFSALGYGGSSGMEGLEFGLFMFFVYPIIAAFIGNLVLIIASWKRMRSQRISLIWIVPFSIWLFMVPSNFVVLSRVFGPGLTLFIMQLFGMALLWIVFLVFMSDAIPRPHLRMVELAAWIIAGLAALGSFAIFAFFMGHWQDMLSSDLTSRSEVLKSWLEFRKSNALMTALIALLVNWGFPLALLVIVLIRRFGSHAKDPTEKDSWHKRYEDVPPMGSPPTTL